MFFIHFHVTCHSLHHSWKKDDGHDWICVRVNICTTDRETFSNLWRNPQQAPVTGHPNPLGSSSSKDAREYSCCNRSATFVDRLRLSTHQSP